MEKRASKSKVEGVGGEDDVLRTRDHGGDSDAGIDIFMVKLRLWLGLVEEVFSHHNRRQALRLGKAGRFVPWHRLLVRKYYADNNI
jgi:hypothetical protein